MSGDSSTSEITAPYGYGADLYFRAGWPVVPVQGKSEPVTGWTGKKHWTKIPSRADIQTWINGPEARWNIAIRPVCLVGIDVDAWDGKPGAEVFAKMQAHLGELPPTWSSTSRGPNQPSRIRIFRVPLDREHLLADSETRLVQTYGLDITLPSGKPGKEAGIEILHRGRRYVICWPSIHPITGNRYEWYLPDGTLADRPPRRDEIPDLPQAWADFLMPPADLRESTVNAPSSFDPFGTPDQLFGTTGAGTKTARAARELLDRERNSFIALTQEGNKRTDRLAGLSLLAGRGAPEVWSRAEARSTLIDAAQANGYMAAHGQGATLLQIDNGLNDGMADPWMIVPERDTPAALQPLPEPELDKVEALLAELLNPEDLAARPAPQYLIKGLLNLDSESWLIGEPGSKKSFVALDMAAHVTAGRRWQGLRTRQTAALIIAAEGAGGFGQRVRAWIKANGAMNPEIRTLPRPVQSGDPKAWTVLVEACRRLAPGLIVLDTQARVTVGLEENSATDMGIFVEAVRALREATGACVLVVHHTGRRGGDARGSSAIDGAQHTELKVIADKTNSMYGKLLSEKQKDMELHQEMPLLFRRVDLGVDEDGDPVNSLVLESDPFAIAAAKDTMRVDAGQVETVREPRQWTRELFDNPRQEVKRRILQVLQDVGGQAGLAEARTQALVAERWHGGKVGRERGQLSKRNFSHAWNDLLDYILPNGEALLSNPSGEKRALNTVGLDRDLS